DLLELGVSSLDLMAVAGGLEAAFGHRPDMERLFRLPSVRAIAAHYEVGLTIALEPGPDEEPPAPPPAAFAPGPVPLDRLLRLLPIPTPCARPRWRRAG